MNVAAPNDPIHDPARPVRSPGRPPGVHDGYQEAEDQTDADFALRQQLDMLRRRWPVGLPVLVIVAALVFSFALFEQPKYTATATVMMSPQQEKVTRTEEVLADVRPDNAVMETELEVLRSRSIAERVVDKLSLGESPAWNPALRDTPVGEQIRTVLMGIIAAPVAWLRPRAPAGLADAPAADQERAAETNPGREAAIRAVMKALEGKRRRLSYVIDVSVESIDPRQAARVANAIVDVYLDAQLEARFEAAQRANSWLSGRLQDMRQEVQAKEAAVERYRSQTGIVDVGGGTIAEQQVSSLQGSVIAARADLAEKEARLRQAQLLVSSGDSAEVVSNLVGSDRIATLRDQESELQRRLADLQGRYGDLHPEVQKARVETSDVRRQIQEEMTRIVTNLENEVKVSRSRLSALQSSTSSIRGEILNNNRALIQLRELQRDAEATRAIYESFLGRFEEIDAQGGLQISNARRLGTAMPPEFASSPKLSNALILALVLGLVVGIGVIYLLETLDDLLGSPDDVLRRTGAPALGTIPVVSPASLKGLPENRRDPPGFLAEKPMSAYAEALRVLRTAVLYSNVDAAPRIVAVTSAMPGEGKTTTSLGLARVAAGAGQRVLVVDCDLRRQSLRGFAPDAPAAGILQVLTGEVAWRDALVSDVDSDAQFLLATAASFTPRDVFASEAMRRLLDEARAAYDLVILDCAPILAVAETRAVARQADVTLVVARFGKTPTRFVRSAVKALNEVGATVLGVVVNCLNPRGVRGGYYYTPYYSKSYQNYYAN